MLLGAVADDFTGASDLANTLAKGGMATTLFVGPNGETGDCEAGVVALKTRSIPANEAVAQSVEAARWLLAQGCQQILFKYCSTFDSTPSGNIGPVAEALLDLLGANVAIVCPAFPATGRRIFMGHLFVGDRLLNESGMENHPLTPMTDPDLRRWLRRQTQGEVGHVSLDSIRAGKTVLAEAIAAQSHASRRLIVADAIADDDLHALGKAAAEHKLITGGSGIAIGLPQNFRDQGRLSNEKISFPEVSGPGIALCGSCSSASQKQVGQYLKDRPGLAIHPGALMKGQMDVPRALDWINSRKDHEPMIYSTADPAAVSDAQAHFGRDVVAAAIEQFFGDLARTLADNGTRRIVVGGGETSGAVVEALRLQSLQIGAEIDPGVPALFADRNGPIGIALKSGNFGSEDFFAKAIKRVGHA
ncbi:3-oxo-tetronate kinase [Pararhizobium qamdonense]|uniref:3-oxo-tetronate kinase n=1 Tax=Pararhizobium qamdonense TaxID=3031126 RepID=UPI0023E2BE35|nr:3-oxo-tetronate kinase [Pararhizobium qamdonense]